MKITIDTNNLKLFNQQIENLTINEIEVLLDFINCNTTFIKEQLMF